MGQLLDCSIVALLHCQIIVSPPVPKAFGIARGTRRLDGSIAKLVD